MARARYRVMREAREEAKAALVAAVEDEDIEALRKAIKKAKEVRALHRVCCVHVSFNFAQLAST